MRGVRLNPSLILTLDIDICRTFYYFMLGVWLNLRLKFSGYLEYEFEHIIIPFCYFGLGVVLYPEVRNSLKYVGR